MGIKIKKTVKKNKFTDNNYEHKFKIIRIFYPFILLKRYSGGFLVVMALFHSE